MTINAEALLIDGSSVDTESHIFARYAVHTDSQ
jgi:hypothetical protein